MRLELKQLRLTTRRRVIPGAALPAPRGHRVARAARPSAPVSHAADGIGKLLLVGVIGGLALLGGLAVLLAALTPAGFGAALLALVLGVPSLLLGRSALRQLLAGRPRHREADGTITKRPRERGALGNAALTLGLSLAGLGAAVALVGHLAFGVGVVYAAAGLLGLYVLLRLVYWLSWCFRG